MAFRLIDRIVDMSAVSTPRKLSDFVDGLRPLPRS